MTNGKKIIAHIIIIVLLSISCIFAGYKIKGARDNKLIGELISNSIKLESELRDTINRGVELSERIREYEAEIREAERRFNERISGLIKEISGYKDRIRNLIKGYETNISTLSGIKGTIGRIIKTATEIKNAE